MKSKLRFHLCFICMLALAVAGCKVKRPNDVIPESKMESLLYDYHLAKSMGDNLPYSENYKKALYIDAVFKSLINRKMIFRILGILLFIEGGLFLRSMELRRLYSTHLWFGIHATQKFYRKSMRK